MPTLSLFIGQLDAENPEEGFEALGDTWGPC